MATEGESVVDRVTGVVLPNVGAEENRQRFERVLLEDKGYHREDIAVDRPIAVTVAGETYHSRIHLVVCGCMAVKCAAGSLGSWEREILAAARLLADPPLKLALVTDGRDAILLETVGGKVIGEGLAAVPSRNDLPLLAARVPLRRLDSARRAREALIFRSYDAMAVNVAPLR